MKITERHSPATQTGEVAYRRRGGRISISVLLVVTIGGLVALSAIAVMAVSTYANFRNTVELLSTSAEVFVDSVESDIDSLLEPLENTVRDLSEDSNRGVFDPMDQAFLQSFFRGAVASTPHLSNLVVVYPNGVLVGIDHVEFGRERMVAVEIVPADPTTIEFSNLMRESERIIWNAPFFEDGVTHISVAAPLLKDGRYMGSIIASTTVRHISKIVSELGKAYGTTGFILYGNDRVLAHPRVSKMPTLELDIDNPLHSLQTLDDPVISQMLKQEPEFPNGKATFDGYEVEVSDGSRLVLTRRIERYGTVPWTIGQYLPMEDWTAQFRRLERAALVSFGILLLSILAAIYLARRMAAPIRNTAERAQKISELNLVEIDYLPPSRITELNAQAMAFNSMLDGLRWFETYLPRNLVRQLIKTRDSSLVESREIELTVMFADIEGFTTLSESRSPKEIAELLNRHFETLNTCIEREGGTIDKYIGDAVLAFWGAPESQPDHAERACRAALAAKKAYEKIGLDYGVKIAIHTGPLIVGNIGAVGRMNYTVIGDTVNTCSRIETLAGDLKSDDAITVLVSGAAAQRLDESFTLDSVGSFEVRGRAEQVTIYRLSA